MNNFKSNYFLNVYNNSIFDGKNVYSYVSLFTEKVLLTVMELENGSEGQGFKF